jgi:Secretion system C-terminal sorting domain/Bacterial Ig-like domain (group 2)/NHL repeat
LYSRHCLKICNFKKNVFMNKCYSIRNGINFCRLLLYLAVTFFCAYPFSINAQIITTVAGGGSSTADGVPATNASINPYKVCVDNTGNIYIAVTNNYVKKVDPMGIITTVAGNGTPVYSGDGGPATAAGIGSLQGVAVDHNGNLYIVQWTGGCGLGYVRKVDPSGTITTIAGNGICGPPGDGGPAINACFNHPQDIAVDSAGNIYIADWGHQVIRKIDSLGIIRSIAGIYGGGGFSGDGGLATAAEIHNPEGVGTDDSGNVYIADRNNYRIRKVNAAGFITTIVGSGSSGFSGDGGPATVAELQSPRVVCVDNAGNIYIPDNNRIREVNSTGIINTIAGNGSGGNCSFALSAHVGLSTGIAVDKSRNVYFIDGGEIKKVFTAGTIEITGASNLCVGTSTVLKDSTHYGTWTSSDSAIASIDNTGQVTGRSGGTAIITYSFSGCFVTDSISVPSAGVISGTNNLCPGDTSIVSETISGGIWTSTNSAIATISPTGVLLGVAPGIDTITYSVTVAGCMGRSIFPIIVRQQADCPTRISITKAPNAGSLDIFPNPCQGKFTLKLLSNTEQDVSIVVTNILGHKIKRLTTYTNKNTELQIAVPGIYFVNVSTNNGNWSKKVVVNP